MAEEDLKEIADYTLFTWGVGQTVRHLDGLETCCQRLAENPQLGRTCEKVLPGLRRMEHESHVVFYRERPWGVFISRILHERMLPARFVFE
jgi:toxin ParE1/3/4